MDLNLPGMDGYEALQALRANPATADIPVVALTANAMRHDAERGLAAGFNRYMTKPFDLDEMARVIGEVTRSAA
jgi:CheY-like chemotaxis protein